MIKLDESLRGIWFCSNLLDEQDFLLALNRIAEEHYEITYRFRYYNSDDPFDENDKKSWYSGKITGKSEKEIIAVIHNQFMPVIAAKNGFTELLRSDQTLDEFVAEFLKQDFVHAKYEKIH